MSKPTFIVVTQLVFLTTAALFYMFGNFAGGISSAGMAALCTLAMLITAIVIPLLFTEFLGIDLISRSFPRTTAYLVLVVSIYMLGIMGVRSSQPPLAFVALGAFYALQASWLYQLALKRWYVYQLYAYAKHV